MHVQEDQWLPPWRSTHSDHVLLGDALSDAHHQGDFRFDGLLCVTRLAWVQRAAQGGVVRQSGSSACVLRAACRRASSSRGTHQDGAGGERRGHVDDTGVCASLLHGLRGRRQRAWDVPLPDAGQTGVSAMGQCTTHISHSAEHGAVQVSAASLLGVGATHDVGAVGDGLQGRGASSVRAPMRGAEIGLCHGG